MTVSFTDGEFEAFAGLADARGGQLERAVLSIGPEFERTFTHDKARQWAPCSSATDPNSRCHFDRGNLKYVKFSRSHATPSFEEGAGAACVKLMTNTSVWLASLPRVANVSGGTGPRSTYPTSTLHAGLRKVFAHCLQGKMVLRGVNTSAEEGPPRLWLSSPTV